jgi:hypothetical protein
MQRRPFVAKFKTVPRTQNSVGYRRIHKHLAEVSVTFEKQKDKLDHKIFC